MGRSKLPSMIQQELKKLTELNRYHHTTALAYAISAPRLDLEIAIRAVRLDQSIDQLAGALGSWYPGLLWKSWMAVIQNLLDLAFMLARYDSTLDQPDDEGHAQLPTSTLLVRKVVAELLCLLLEDPTGLGELVYKSSAPRGVFRQELSRLLGSVQVTPQTRLASRLSAFARLGSDLIQKHYKLRTDRDGGGGAPPRPSGGPSPIQPHSDYDYELIRYSKPWKRPGV